MNIIDYQLRLINETLKEYEMRSGPDSRTFDCDACERTFDNFAQDEYGRCYFKVAGKRICDLCYDDWGTNGNFEEIKE